MALSGIYNFKFILKEMFPDCIKFSVFVYFYVCPAPVNSLSESVVFTFIKHTIMAFVGARNEKLKNALFTSTGMVRYHVGIIPLFLTCAKITEPRREKPGLRGFRPGLTQLELYKHRR